MKIHKGDNVIVISGADKGKTGSVRRVMPSRQSVIIEGVNVRKKHERARRANQKGQLIEKAMPIHVSNVALMEPGSGKAARAGRKLVGEKWVRISRKSGKEI